MESSRIDLSCTACGYVFTDTTPMGHTNTPEAGSVSICIECANIDIFTRDAFGALALRAATPEERVEILDNPAVTRIVAELIGLSRE